MDDRRSSARPDGTHRLFDDAAAARRFQRHLREVAPGGYTRPALHYDESGYPIEDRTSLAERVRRLIRG